ncbi:hypothetical protein C4A77_24860 [Brevibacillus laterosporus]|uniref:Integrase catalytic domain-containing protein n=1 Tax=Brevibacillus laterosporus TaxID=1465 RepID=A0AAP8U2W1_BRELA|nr:hypothetical protein C4A77_24860 [Brevibacillus laterosporus]
MLKQHRERANVRIRGRFGLFYINDYSAKIKRESYSSLSLYILSKRILGLRSVTRKKYIPQKGAKPVENKIRHFYSRKGTPYNNVGIESLQKEEIYRTSYEDFEEAKRALFSYIEGFYNRNRIHSSIDYQTPQELEEKILSKIT